MTVTPGGVVSASGESVTPGKLNQLATPTFTITGTAQNSDLATGAVSAEKAQSDNYWYAGTGGTSTAYTLDLGTGIRPDSLADGTIIQAKLHTSCGNAPTINVTGSSGSALGAKKIRRPADLAVVANDFLINQVVQLVYNSSADGGTGAWVAQSPPAVYSPAVVADSRNLVCKNNGATPNTKVDITADAVVLAATDNQPYLATNVSLTIDTGAANGANALDSGGLGTGWYYVYVIFNPATNTVAGLMSLSGSAPAMPSGYTFKALVGSIYSAAAVIRKFWQTQRRVHIGGSANRTGPGVGVCFLHNIAGPGANTWQAASATASTNPINTLLSPISKTCFGVAGITSTSTDDPRIGFAGDATELYGIQVISGPSSASGTAIDNFKGSGTFEVPTITPGDFFWAASNTAINRVVISGYTI